MIPAPSRLVGPSLIDGSSGFSVTLRRTFFRSVETLESFNVGQPPCSEGNQEVSLMPPEFLTISPVLPSADIKRDVHWYKEKAGFELSFADHMYAVLFRNNLSIHLQWHADTENDPLLGGSVVRIFVQGIETLFDEFVQRGTVRPDSLRRNTPWHTNEFGFHDLNKNAVFIVEDIPGL